jgi:hypothetical protein
MGKSKEISQDLRKKIVDLHKSGSSLGAISKCLIVLRSSVQTIVVVWSVVVVSSCGPVVWLIQLAGALT